MNLLILIAYIVYVGVFGHANGHTCVNDRPRVRQFEEAQRARREFNEKYNRTRIDHELPSGGDGSGHGEGV